MSNFLPEVSFRENDEQSPKDLLVTSSNLGSESAVVILVGIERLMTAGVGVAVERRDPLRSPPRSLPTETTEFSQSIKI